LSLWKKLFSHPPASETSEGVRLQLERFQQIVQHNNSILARIADAGEQLSGEYIFDTQYLRDLAEKLAQDVRAVVQALNELTGGRYQELVEIVSDLDYRLRAMLEGRTVTPAAAVILRLEEIGTELAGVAGEKMARLGELSRVLGIPVPAGVVVSADACRRFLDELGITTIVTANRELPGEQLQQLAGELQQRILDARVPRWLSRNLRRAARKLLRQSGAHSLAVRSSAVGEDGEVSFAGQYHTELGVSPGRIEDAYRRVVASLFSSRVVEYRQRHGLDPLEGLMAVGILAMVPARASGVVYTLDPNSPASDALLIGAGWGLGCSVVDGSQSADRFLVSRRPPHEIVGSSLASKEFQVVTTPLPGTQRQAVAPERHQVPALTPEQLAELAGLALRVERYGRCAQDIEWALDEQGRLLLLQARPLRVSPSSAASAVTVDNERYPVLLQGRGEVACRGVGCGPVWIPGEQASLNDVPEQAVVVSPTATPRLAAWLPRAAAVVTDVGSATGHLAAVAREFRIPTIVDTHVASRVLVPGEMVTVDADENIVYRGEVEELIKEHLLQESSFEEKREFRLLRRMLHQVAPLNLDDPSSRKFSAGNCRTYHDVIRFAHEMAVRELVRGRWLHAARAGQSVYRLAVDIPIDLLIIDLGGGVEVPPGRSEVSLEEVTSAPLLFLLRGLVGKGVWATEPADMDLGGFMSSATRTSSLATPLTVQPEQNVAIVSTHYLSLNLKLGYHYNLVNCRLADDAGENFVYFRFAGGVTELARRSRRAMFLRRVLERYDFVVESKGDLVIARLKMVDGERLRGSLEMIGRLVGFTRQLDIYLRSDELVEAYVEKFLSAAGGTHAAAGTDG